MVRRELFVAAVLVAWPAALYAARVFYSGEFIFGFLLFNLALAAVPLVCAVWVQREHSSASPWSRIRLVVALSVWLLFLPNAPYILSDYVHLRPRAGVPLWYDVGLLASYGLAGLFLGVRSLALVHSVLDSRLGRLSGWLVVITCTALSGFGVWMGRFLRWNSWDAVVRPVDVASQVMPMLLAPPTEHPRMWVVTLAFGTTFFVAYVAFRSFPGTHSAPSRLSARPTR